MPPKREARTPAGATADDPPPPPKRTRKAKAVAANPAGKAKAKPKPKPKPKPNAAPPPPKQKHTTAKAAAEAGPLSQEREAIESPHHTKAAEAVYSGPAAPPIASWRGAAQPAEEEVVALIAEEHQELSPHLRLRLASMYGIGAGSAAAAAPSPPLDEQGTTLQREMVSDIGTHFTHLVRGVPPDPPPPTAPLALGTVFLRLKPSYSGRPADISKISQRNAVIDTCFGQYIRQSSASRIAQLAPEPASGAASAAAALFAPVPSSGAGSAASSGAASAASAAASEPNNYAALHAAHLATVLEKDRVVVRMAPLMGRGWQQPQADKEALAAARAQYGLLEKKRLGLGTKLMLLPMTERECLAAGLSELAAGTDAVRHAFTSAPNSAAAGGYEFHRSEDASKSTDPSCSTYLLFGGVEKYVWRSLPLLLLTYYCWLTD